MAEPQKVPVVPQDDDGDDELGLIEVRLQHRGADVRATGMPAAMAELVRWLSDEPGPFEVDVIPAAPPAQPAPPAR